MRVIVFLFVILLSSCSRTSSETWEDMKTAGRYLGKGIKSLWGGEYESRQLLSDNEFRGPEDDFLPLEEEEMSEYVLASTPMQNEPRKESTKSREISNLDSFQSPPGRWKDIFRTIHFTTDDHVIRDKKDLVTVARIANFLKRNKNASLIIEGHCDKRASAEYNMALGMRRAHHIRVLLSKQGVDSSRVYTISYGKEKPISYGDTPDSFFQNRRAQFRIKMD